MTIRDDGPGPADGGLFKALFDTAPDAMIVVNRDGSIVLANPQAERLFGYASGAFTGASRQGNAGRVVEADGGEAAAVLRLLRPLLGGPEQRPTEHVDDRGDQGEGGDQHDRDGDRQGRAHRAEHAQRGQ